MGQFLKNWTCSIESIAMFDYRRVNTCCTARHIYIILCLKIQHDNLVWQNSKTNHWLNPKHENRHKIANLDY